MSKTALQEILAIVKKLGWNDKPAEMVLTTINYMIVCEQCNNMCDGKGFTSDEEILHTISHYSAKKLWQLKHEARELQMVEQ